MNKSFVLKLFLFVSPIIILSQNNIYQNLYQLPDIKLRSKLYFLANKEHSKLIKPHSLNIIFNSDYIYNDGHPNIDNYSEIYSLGSLTTINGARFIFSNKWLLLELEPYQLISNYSRKNTDNQEDTYMGTFAFNNNSSTSPQKTLGFKQSRILIHYNGLGLSYGNMSNWWGPGFHSSISLSTNAPSQKTYSIGTFKDIAIGKYTFNSMIIVMPYENFNNEKIYFSGIKLELGYKSNPSLKLGINRSYLSGDLNKSFKIEKPWTIQDASSLIFEPLFGQSKKNLDYIIPGTPGFDLWDEVLSGYITIFFPEKNLELYLNLASDDNRANFVDLRAHWDHTLGYLIGLTKFSKIREVDLFFGIEFLTTRVSNTFKPEFYRGDEPPNYYAKPHYAYFTYQGRRMGAHSGSSSDDLNIKFGFARNKLITFFTLNIERHGIKEMQFPEIKNEISLSFDYNLSKKINLFCSIEYEKIKNINYIDNKYSNSTYLWIGTSRSIK